MDHFNPLVSVIVPCYNCEYYIDDCIASISSQSYKQIEVILVNDGSTDRTEVKIVGNQSRDERIRYYRISNSGPAKARNYGISHSTGELIMFVDADDILMPNAIHSFVENYLVTEADIIFSYSNKFFNGGIQEDDSYVRNTLLKEYFNNAEYVQRRMIGLLEHELAFPTKTDAFNTPWAKLYKAELIKGNQIQFKDRAYIGMEDVLFNIECVLHAEKFSSIDLCTYSYRQINDHSVSRIDTLNLWQKIKNLCTEITNSPFYRKEYTQALSNRMYLMSINVLLSITNPRIQKKIDQRMSEIKSFVSDPVFLDALLNVEYKYLPLPFKVLYITCRTQMPLFIYPIVMVMRLKRKK